MKILLAPDSFKGTLDALSAATALSDGLLSVLPGLSIDIQPLSDGGEGFVNSCCAQDCTGVSLKVSGPLGEEVNASYGIRGHDAIIEMAAAAGIELLEPGQYAPMEASTYGVGQMISDAVKRNARQVYVGLGGSVTHDAGFGMLRAAGARFYGGEGEVTIFRQVENIKSIDLSKISQLINNVDVICAADVTNPLLGDHGAARIYAKQKGASPEEVNKLESLTEIFSSVVEQHLGRAVRSLPGAGAAGGTAFALMACMGAKMEPGFDVVSRLTRLEERVRESSLVITGEGYLDAQSSFGKAPVRLLRMAQDHGIPVVGVFGGRGESDENFDRIYSLTELAGSTSDAMMRPVEFLRMAAADLARAIASGTEFKKHA